MTNRSFVSRIAPVLGIEFRQIRKRIFINDFIEDASVTTSQFGTIPGSSFYHSYKPGQISLRAGMDWIFFDLEKRKFIITLLYSFAFRDAGYFRYHFSRPGVADFYFQTQTKGNGVALKLAVPVKVL